MSLNHIVLCFDFSRGWANSRHRNAKKNLRGEFRDFQRFPAGCGNLSCPALCINHLWYEVRKYFLDEKAEYYLIKDMKKKKCIEQQAASLNLISILQIFPRIFILNVEGKRI